ncbi:hypothetical protein STEG23_036029, partial [Scotinomys teguina]
MAFILWLRLGIFRKRGEKEKQYCAKQCLFWAPGKETKELDLKSFQKKKNDDDDDDN